MAQENLSAKQKQTHREQRGKGMDWKSGIGRSKLITFRMGEPQVPNV